jgi:hypothetical protein
LKGWTGVQKAVFSEEPVGEGHRISKEGAEMKGLNLNSKQKKAIISALVVLVGILAASSVVNRAIDSSFVHGWEEKANQYLLETAKRAGFIYLAARGINAGVSLLQSVEVGVVAASLHPGQALDPVNDAVERLSWIMLLSLASIGVQKILMEMAPWLGTVILLSIAMLVILLGIWLPKYMKIDLRGLGLKLVLLALVVRFFIPVAYVMNQAVYTRFLDSKYTAAAGAVAEAKDALGDKSEGVQGTAVDEAGNEDPGEVRELSPLPQEGEEGLIATAKKWMKNTAEVGSKIDRIKAVTVHFFEHTVSLTVIFLLQTILIPMFVLWLLVKLMGFAVA